MNRTCPFLDGGPFKIATSPFFTFIHTFNLLNIAGYRGSSLLSYIILETQIRLEFTNEK